MDKPKKGTSPGPTIGYNDPLAKELHDWAVTHPNLSRLIGLIRTMNEEDAGFLLPLVEHIAGLRESLEILEEEPEILAALEEAGSETAKGKVRAVGRK